MGQQDIVDAFTYPRKSTLVDTPRPWQDSQTANPHVQATWVPQVGETVKDTVDVWLDGIDCLLPDTDYWYLAGPMSGIPAFNYPEFDRVSALLREQGYSIVSPAEFEHEDERRRIHESSGVPEPGITPWQDCLARDVVVVANPKCIGIILIDGWHESRGALLETQVASSLGKPLFEYSDPFTLRLIDRQEALEAYEDSQETDWTEWAKQVVKDIPQQPYVPQGPPVQPLPADEWWKRQPPYINPLDIRVVD